MDHCNEFPTLTKVEASIGTNDNYTKDKRDTIQTHMILL